MKTKKAIRPKKKKKFNKFLEQEAQKRFGKSYSKLCDLRKKTVRYMVNLRR